MQSSACENGLEHAHPPRAMRLSDLLLKGLGGASASLLGNDRLIKDICLDSRLAGPDSAFVAVQGAQQDGLRFVEDARRRGAQAVIADRDMPHVEGHTIARVADARAAASRLAATLYGLADAQAAGYRLAGITGTNGKSTIAYMVRAILQTANRPCAMIGTIQYDVVRRVLPAPLTTPDAVSLVRHLMDAHAAGARDGVLEVSSHSLEQHRTAGLRFSAAVFSNLTQDHLDYHGTLDAYLAAKRKLFESLDADATAIVNADDPQASAMIDGCRARIMRFGFREGADLLAHVRESDLDGSRFVVSYHGRDVEFETPLVGRHNVSNALAALGVGLSLNVDVATIHAALKSLKNVPGRLQRVDTANLGFTILVDYAHTDDALRNVLSAVRGPTKGRLFCVFGCGGDRDKTKRPRMARAVADAADRFVITSDNPRTEDPAAIIRDVEAGLTADDRKRCDIEPDRALAISLAVSQLKPGDALIIAGKGHEDYQILGSERIHFDDVEVAAAAVRGLGACVH
ncbi:MAG: UDP-N-acetylmuramoyl-L-alanyl-D-glutamate--2,6-diaminopimelate ligase [Phycisphaerales bacterium]|nr:UDP-N-acetylmuramoyl-L-alanyl-D-glutamate--2,6-diaminopimelate ligase [Phycisphaerales bacterium]MCB9863641.1 UDP-N-acetylmuramoyl-L-alanyl-D-glutamate--2,6-diaminopimelate ligase [Phycisphaerales bacterium]